MDDRTAGANVGVEMSGDGLVLIQVGLGPKKDRDWCWYRDGTQLGLVLRRIATGLKWIVAGIGVETARLMPVGTYLELLADLAEVSDRLS